MRINKLEIENFGKFKNYTLDFTGGFSVLFGENEEGKSTIMSFILLMFYSNHGRSQSLDQMPRKLYTPWDGTTMSGAMEFSDSGINYRLQKQFADTPGRDKTTLINLDLGTEVALPRGVEVGKFFFELDLAGFKRSSFIGQIGRIEPGKDTDDVAEKLLINLVSGENIDGSRSDTIGRLEAAKLGLVSKNGSKGILAEAKQTCQKLEEEKAEVKALLESQKELEEQYGAYKKMLEERQEISGRLETTKSHQQREKLEGLLSLKRERRNLLDSVTTPNYSFQATGELIIESNELLEQREQKLGTAKSIDVQEAAEAEISADEWEAKEKAENQLEQAKALYKSYETTVEPAMYERVLKKLAYEGALAEHEELRDEHYQLMPQKEELEQASAAKEQLTVELDSCRRDFSQMKIMWEKEKGFRERELKNYEEQLLALEQHKKRKLNVSWIVLAVVIGLASIAGGILFNPLCFLGFILVAGAVLLGLTTGGAYKTPEAVAAEEKLANTKAEVKQWEKDILPQINQLGSKEEQLAREQEKTATKITSINETLESNGFWRISEQLTQYEDRLERLRLEHSTAVRNVDQQINQIAQQLEDWDKQPEESEQAEEHRLRDVLTALTERKQEKLTQLLAEKNAKTLKQYSRFYIESQAKQQNMLKIKELEEEVATLENRFLQLVSGHTPQENFATAVEFLENLKLKTHQVVTLGEHGKLTANALGMENTTTEILEKKLGELGTEQNSFTSEEIEALEHRHNELKSIDLFDKMGELQKLIRPPARNLEQVAQELVEIKEQIAEAQFYYDGLEAALEVMEQADAEMRSSFGPIVNETTSEIFRELTRDRYDALLVNKDYGIQFKAGVHFREWQYLSSGTTDQAYLALRLAISKLISNAGNPIPLFLDDVLMQYDDGRARAAMEFLQKYSKKEQVQIILVTCHGRIVDYGKSIGINTSNIA